MLKWGVMERPFSSRRKVRGAVGGVMVRGSLEECHPLSRFYAYHWLGNINMVFLAQTILGNASQDILQPRVRVKRGVKTKQPSFIHIRIITDSRIKILSETFGRFMWARASLFLQGNFFFFFFFFFFNQPLSLSFPQTYEKTNFLRNNRVQASDTSRDFKALASNLKILWCLHNIYKMKERSDVRDCH